MQHLLSDVALVEAEQIRNVSFWRLHSRLVQCVSVQAGIALRFCMQIAPIDSSLVSGLQVYAVRLGGCCLTRSFAEILFAVATPRVMASIVLLLFLTHHIIIMWTLSKTSRRGSAVEGVLIYMSMSLQRSTAAHHRRSAQEWTGQMTRHGVTSQSGHERLYLYKCSAPLVIQLRQQYALI